MSGAIPPLPNTPSWLGAQVKHRDNFTFLPLVAPGRLVLQSDFRLSFRRYPVRLPAWLQAILSDYFWVSLVPAIEFRDCNLQQAIIASFQILLIISPNAIVELLPLLRIQEFPGFNIGYCN
jgi:hypothetical protein